MDIKILENLLKFDDRSVKPEKASRPDYTQKDYGFLKSRNVELRRTIGGT